MSAERYWEGRWRDERAENDRLRAALKELDTLFEFGADTFSCACFPLGKQEHLQAAFKQAHAAIEASDEQKSDDKDTIGEDGDQSGSKRGTAAGY